MDQSLIPRRYAKALYEVAATPDAQRTLYNHMQQLAASFAAEPSLQTTMANPFVSDADKVALIYAASGTTEKDADMANFVRVLKENARLGMVRDIAMAYDSLYRKSNDIYRVQVVAAAPMAEAEQQRLKSLILSRLKGGKMEYDFKVDPDLIGGFVVNIDNERLDASVKNELKQLRLKLLSNKKA